MLNEVNLKETQLIFFRQQIRVFASELMYEFCLHVNVNYFKKLFNSMRISKDYTAVCYRTMNKHSSVDGILDDHPVIDLTES